ncbi:UNVERIFIED_CONTAM: hypothetical protein GTU68_052069 [Idotea baltica]|nr:hypothetical protein [Idotea baltica]
MLTVSNLSLQFGKRILFDEVSIKFTLGNCYGVIGANGAGKSTFLKIISKEFDPTSGHVTLDKGKRMAVLSQDHFGYEEEIVLNVVMQGHEKLWRIGQEKEAIYNNPEATEADFMKAADMEAEFGEMNGYNAESDAAELLSLLGLSEEYHGKLMSELNGGQKVKVLLSQALFGNPDILLLDEPTNDLDPESVNWLSNFLAGYKNTVIVVSHDRYFLDMVCTHIVDIDFKNIRLFSGNYTFWYEANSLMRRQQADRNKKTEMKKKELQEFISRFSANASKSKQATSRKKALEKLDVEKMEPSTRRYPFINFTPERAPGGQILKVEGLTKRAPDGRFLFKDVSFAFGTDHKIALLGQDPAAVSALLDILAGESEPDSGSIEWGQTIIPSYLPNDNDQWFKRAADMNLVEWLLQYRTKDDQDDNYTRGFLGRMLFSGEEVFKKVSVLSGGEKVRCMLSRMMFAQTNFLIMDEPTNHLDLESIQALNKAMTETVSNVIFTSHDYQLTNSVANRIIEIAPNSMIDRMVTFEEYITREDIKEQRKALHAGVMA